MISRRGLFALPLALPFVPLAEAGEIKAPPWLWSYRDDLTRDTGIFRTGLYMELQSWGISDEECHDAIVTWFKSADHSRGRCRQSLLCEAGSAGWS